MDVAKLFRGISSQLHQEFFAISSQINHQGSKGTFREDMLKKFLGNGRLPKKFGVGSGEIVGPLRNVSKQSDLIIYDQWEGLSFLYSDQIQVYPVESVYGVIEVKSSLSKEELIKSLDNIKSVKSLSLNESAPKKVGSTLVSYPKPKPFGIIFSYSLANNSLKSLTENMIEWESNNKKEYWTNLVVILEKGVIYHIKENHISHKLLSNNDLLRSIKPSYLEYEQDTLYYFYSILIDLCSSVHLGEVNLNRYFDPPERIGVYIVKNHDRILSMPRHKLSLQFIEKLVRHCQEKERMTERDVFFKQMGSIPPEMSTDYLNNEVYLYDPENLPGMHEVINPFECKENRVFATQKMQVPSSWVAIDEEIYYFSLAYIEEGDTELIKE